MQITLNDDEVREALKTALENKLDNIFGSLEADSCYFKVTTSKGEVEDLETVEFTVNL